MADNIVEFGSEGARLIGAERLRQMQEEGWSRSHDEMHGAGELAGAAVAYVHHASFGKSIDWILKFAWPWEPKWFKPAEPIRELVKAGALIAAEIDRLTALKAG